MIAELIKKNRSCRRFYQDHYVDPETLKKLVELARLSASAANLQPLNYILSSEPSTNSLIFSCLAWAGYLKEWTGPKEGEKPSAYIVILGNTKITTSFGCDHGIAGQSILLGAREKGLAGCMIGSIQRERLADMLNIDEKYKILLVIAIGRPKEKTIIENIGQGGDIRYWRDNNNVHHIPKRTLKNIIIDCFC